MLASSFAQGFRGLKLLQGFLFLSCSRKYNAVDHVHLVVVGCETDRAVEVTG